MNPTQKVKIRNHFFPHCSSHSHQANLALMTSLHKGKKKHKTREETLQYHIPANVIVSLLLSAGNDFPSQSKLADLALKFKAI